MATTKTPSVNERLKGNNSFKQAEAYGICYTLKKGRLQDAIKYYIQAQNLAKNPDETASACKNLGKASWKLAQLMRETCDDNALVFYHLQTAVKAFDLSLIEAENCKSEEWKADIWKTFALCIEEFLEMSDEIEDLDLRIKTLRPIIDNLHVNFFIVQLHLKIGNSYFHDGVNKIHEGDFSRCLSRMKDCYYPIQEAKRLSTNSDFEDSEISVLETDVFYTTCTAESVQARHCGSEMLEKAVRDEENLNMDQIWAVIDWFKRAIILSRELDLEQEAIALGRLAYVYNKVLKLRQRSKTHYKKAFELVESMKPRTFFTEKWYQEIVSTLKEFQIEEQQWDEKEKQKEREKKVEAIKEEMKDLKEKNTGKVDFLVHVYNTYPPRHGNWEKPKEEDVKLWKDMTDKEIGKVLRTALAAYHPDKINKKHYGEKYKTLCEEIYKLLSAHYESTKLHCND